MALFARPPPIAFQPSPCAPGAPVFGGRIGIEGLLIAPRATGEDRQGLGPQPIRTTPNSLAMQRSAVATLSTTMPVWLLYCRRHPGASTAR